MNKHSPLPWHVSEQNKLAIWASPYLHRIAEVCIPPDGSMERKEAYANAKYIVEACNAHASLKQTNAELLAFLKMILAGAEGKLDPKTCPSEFELQKQARDLIKRAEGASK